MKPDSMQEQDWKRVREDTLKYLGQLDERRSEEQYSQELHFPGHIIAMHLSRVVNDPYYGKVTGWEVERIIDPLVEKGLVSRVRILSGEHLKPESSDGWSIRTGYRISQKGREHLESL